MSDKAPSPATSFDALIALLRERVLQTLQQVDAALRSGTVPLSEKTRNGLEYELRDITHYLETTEGSPFADFTSVLPVAWLQARWDAVTACAYRWYPVFALTHGAGSTSGAIAFVDSHDPDALRKTHVFAAEYILNAEGRLSPNEKRRVEQNADYRRVPQTFRLPPDPLLALGFVREARAAALRARFESVVRDLQYGSTPTFSDSFAQARSVEARRKHSLGLVQEGEKLRFSAQVQFAKTDRGTLVRLKEVQGLPPAAATLVVQVQRLALVLLCLALRGKPDAVDYAHASYLPLEDALAAIGCSDVAARPSAAAVPWEQVEAAVAAGMGRSRGVPLGEWAGPGTQAWRIAHRGPLGMGNYGASIVLLAPRMASDSIEAFRHACKARTGSALGNMALVVGRMDGPAAELLYAALDEHPQPLAWAVTSVGAWGGLGPSSGGWSPGDALVPTLGAAMSREPAGDLLLSLLPSLSLVEPMLSRLWLALAHVVSLGGKS